jgi:hypothetical protein
MGRARGRKLTVEESLCLSTVELHRSGVFSAPFGTSFTCRWHRPNSINDNTASYKVIEVPALAIGLLFSYEVSHGMSGASHSMEYVIGVTTTRCHYGARRFWFQCPLVCNGVPCKRRVLKLYLPPGAVAFGCKTCYGLTYRSCQEADKRVYRLARSLELLPIALRTGTLRQQQLAISAVAVLIKRANRQSARRKMSKSDFIQRGRYAKQT